MDVNKKGACNEKKKEIINATVGDGGSLEIKTKETFNWLTCF